MPRSASSWWNGSTPGSRRSELWSASSILAAAGSSPMEVSPKLPRDIGSKYEYSNLGGGLLGSLLARRAGVDYEALVRSRICDPLGMTNTRITLSPEMRARLAVGHNDRLSPTANWDLPTLAGAG